KISFDLEKVHRLINNFLFNSKMLVRFLIKLRVTDNPINCVLKFNICLEKKLPCTALKIA
ncbi:MAG: hypothetical protein ABI416_08890, partial [Ginsengibacter sp.]